MPLQDYDLADIRYEIAIPMYSRWSCCEDKGKTALHIWMYHILLSI